MGNILDDTFQSFTEFLDVQNDNQAAVVKRKMFITDNSKMFLIRLANPFVQFKIIILPKQHSESMTEAKLTTKINKLELMFAHFVFLSGVESKLISQHLCL